MTKWISVLLLIGLFASDSAEAVFVATPLVIDPSDDAFAQRRLAAAPDASASPVNVERQPSGNPLWAIPLRQLTATRERPLFTPSRRPPPPVMTNAYQVAAVPPPVAAKPAEPEKPQLTLVGTVAGDAEGIAVFVDQTAKAVLRLKIGDGHNGWVLREVNRREVVLQKGTEATVLALPSPEMSKITAIRQPALGTPSRGTSQINTTPALQMENSGALLRLPIGNAPVSQSVGATPGSAAAIPFALPSGVRPSMEPTTFNPFKTPARAP